MAGRSSAVTAGSRRLLVASLLALTVLTGPVSALAAAPDDPHADGSDGADRTAPDVASSSPSAGQPPQQVVVRWARDAGGRERDLARRAVRGQKVRGLRHLDGEVLDVPAGRTAEDLARELEASGAVLDAEPNVRYRALVSDDPSAGRLYGLENTGQVVNGRVGRTGIDIEARPAWTTTRGAPTAVVAVIDTAVDIRHPDLAPNLWRNPREVAGNARDDDANGYVDDVHGWDFVRRAPLTATVGAHAAHGTHVAGTIAAVADNRIGVAGVAPGARVMALRVLGDDGFGDLAAVSEAVAYAAANGAAVANLSLGSTTHSDLLRRVMSGSDVAFAVAAGNEQTNTDLHPSYPSSYVLPNLLSVTAVDNRGARPAWANVGARTVQVGAPGVDIYSTVPGGYGWMSGTSMAAPHVAGVLALAASVAPSASAATLVSNVRATTTPLSSLASITTTGGMVNAEGAVRRTASPEITDGTGMNDGISADGPDAGTVCGAAATVVPFTDVRGTAHETAIGCAVGRQLISGYGDRTYRPQAGVSRAQVAAFTYRLMTAVGHEPAPGRPRFRDVVGTAHASTVDALAAIGIVQGATADLYRPQATVTRAQVASLLVRVHEHVTGTVITRGPHPFRDVAATTHEDAIARAWRAGLVMGTDPTTYDPQAPVRRGQMASLLIRLMESIRQSAR